jgi:DNA-binding response OmpR family regulator
LSVPPPLPRVAVVIEDDPGARDVITAVLVRAGFTCVVATTGTDGVQAVQQHHPILTTLDIGLPGVDGFEVARQLRSFSTTYVIMISVRDEESDILMGLDAGADDYLVKPFRPRELRARIGAMLRRVEGGRPPAHHWPAHQESAVDPPSVPPTENGVGSGWLHHKALRLHPAMWLCELGGVPLDLTRSEFSLLRAVVQADRRVVTKHALASALRRTDPDGSATAFDRRAVEVHMANLRRKLDDRGGGSVLIETVRGVGYRLSR